MVFEKLNNTNPKYKNSKTTYYELNNKIQIKGNSTMKFSLNTYIVFIYGVYILI